MSAIFHNLQTENCTDRPSSVNINFFITQDGSLDDLIVEKQNIIKEKEKNGYIWKKSEKKYIEEITILNWLYQCASAINYLHKKNFIHRDIKPK